MEGLNLLLSINDPQSFLDKLEEHPELLTNRKIIHKKKKAELLIDIVYLLNIDNPFEFQQELNEYGGSPEFNYIIKHPLIIEKITSSNKEINDDVKIMDELYLDSSDDF